MNKQNFIPEEEAVARKNARRAKKRKATMRVDSANVKELGKIIKRKVR